MTQTPNDPDRPPPAKIVTGFDAAAVRTTGAQAAGATALGLAVIGMTLLGALTVARMVIGRLTIGKLKVKTLKGNNLPPPETNPENLCQPLSFYHVPLVSPYSNCSLSPSSSGPHNSIHQRVLQVSLVETLPSQDTQV